MIIAIVQARMGATRLPCKMMLDLCGKPVIERVFERIKPSHFINEIWLAITINPEDDVLVDWAKKNKIKFFRGSSDDVLDRFYQAAAPIQADAIVRITGDCPLHDFQVIDKVIAEYVQGGYDYVSNSHPPTYPDGLDVEVFSFQALKKAWSEAELKSEREHVTPYIWKHPDIFKIKNVVNVVDLSDQRWTLDTKEDWEFLKIIFQEIKIRKEYGHLSDVVAILQEHPEWLKINSQYKRNEGYQKSIKADYV